MERVVARKKEGKMERVKRRVWQVWWLLVVLWALWLLVTQPHTAGAWVGMGAGLLVVGALLRI